MRLKQRSTVVLPQPDGPMNAVISFLRIAHVDVADRPERAVVDVEIVDVEDHGRLGARVDARARRLGRGIAATGAVRGVDGRRMPLVGTGSDMSVGFLGRRVGRPIAGRERSTASTASRVAEATGSDDIGPPTSVA